VQSLCKVVAAKSKPAGRVVPSIVQVNCCGNVAVAHTVEQVEPGTALKAAVRRKRGDAVVPSLAQVMVYPISSILDNAKFHKFCSL
jgi:hypothetical protein